MIRTLIIAVLVAALLHGGVLLFGGAIKFLFVKQTDTAADEVDEVEIVEETKEKETPEEVKKADQIPEPAPEQMPDTTVLEALEQTPQTPALSAVSLADLESALSGLGAGSGGAGANFGSGGFIGGTGGPGSGGDINEIIGGGAGAVTKPRVVSSPAPDFPGALQRKGGSVALMVWVGDDGRVMKVAVESSSEPSFEKPAIDAVRRWTFEPAMSQGRKVPAKLRQVIRISPGKV